MAYARRAISWVGAAVALLVAVVGGYLLLDRLADQGPEFAANRVVLPALSIAITVLALGLSGVLARNLVRLVLDRKRGILGAKLRTKLVFFFLALVLLPALVISYGAGAVIRTTVEAIFRTPVDQFSREAGEIAEGWRDLYGTRCRDAAVEAAGEIERFAPDAFANAEIPTELLRRLEGAVRRGGLRMARVTVHGSELLRVDGPSSAQGNLSEAVIERELDRIAAEAVDRQVPTSRVLSVGTAWLAVGAAPWGRATAREGPPEGEVAVAIAPPHDVVQKVARIASSAEAYRQLRAERRKLLRLYYGLIAVIGLATVFVASWIGFYVSRRITVPIQDLASAAREISTGNLGVRVRADAGDEVGMLVEAFNEMAAQLQESREVITRSTADLRSSYQALEDRRRYIETLVESLSTAVVSIDPEGRVTISNPAVGRILGLDLHSGEDLLERLRAPGLEALRSLVARRAPFFPLRHEIAVSPRGERLTVSVRVSPLRGNQGQDLGTLVMVEDLTDLLRAEKAAAWQEVARRLAHEIKNPLTPIRLAAQRLRKKFDEGALDLVQVLPESTASIEREVITLKRLVDEFSRFARLPAVSPERVDFAEIVESAVALYRGMTGVRWEIDLQTRPLEARVDPDQMRRVLINLLDNAIAAVAGEGTIRVAATAPSGAGSLRVEVSDSGPGVPPGDRDRLFAPSFSTKGRGTGLGLAIVLRIVTDHQGTIRVEDNTPRGARFVIEIPPA